MARLEILATADGNYRWCLRAGNYRMLAASAAEFADRPSCLRHVELATALAGTHPPFAQRHAGGRWGWVLADGDGLVVARSVAEYTRRAECVEAMARVVDFLVRA
ncbi:hypothetical protein AB0M46_13970 [Dactylosporangium sp. NPDC051485]|uniref:hypothetical protein n=1 Tax=Dactylosporangium sp. NPDC051485 TaxID=3154846 RepID=UPI0034368DB3